MRFFTPAIFISVFMLFFNDHYLKFNYTSFLTGKISDFCFLFFFPILLIALFSIKNKKARLGVYIFTAALFSLINISPVFSDQFVQLLKYAGIHFKLWPDLSDLVALLIIPFSWRHLHHSVDQPKSVRFKRTPLEYALIGLAIVFTLNTSYFSYENPPEITDCAIVVTSQTADSVSLSWTKAIQKSYSDIKDAGPQDLLYHIYYSYNPDIYTLDETRLNGTLFISDYDISSTTVNTLAPASTVYFNIIVEDTLFSYGGSNNENKKSIYCMVQGATL